MPWRIEFTARRDGARQILAGDQYRFDDPEKAAKEVSEFHAANNPAWNGEFAVVETDI